jgi:hypothetical protein
LRFSKGALTTAHVGKWTKEEDSTLKDAVEKHNGEDWADISALVLGRTKAQCRFRWVNHLAPSRITITIAEKECGTTNKASCLG